MHDTSQLLTTITIAIFAAVSIQVASRRFGQPAIVLLLLGGILLGPEVLGLVQPAAFGSGLTPMISLAVAIVLFEGGLSLDVEGFKLAPRVIWRMLTIGVLVTWVGVTAALVWLYHLDLDFAVLAASLVIVTGPTVIGPILRRIRLGDRLHQILHWEGVLIDPLGVFLALGSYEWLVSEPSLDPIVDFGARILLGTAMGVVAGYGLRAICRLDWFPEDYDNVFVFSGALLVFGICDVILSEAGILAVTVAGLVFGLSRSRRVRRVKEFKLDLTRLSIGVLFIVLAARLDVGRFADLGVEGLAVLLVVMLLRPVNIILSAWGSPLSWRERAFLSALAPRGIVAASMASLFALTLAESRGADHASAAWFLEVFTYAVIGTTVVIQGFSANAVARMLHVRRPKRRTWLIVGARRFGRGLGQALVEAGVPAVLVDRNGENVRRATEAGLRAVERDVLDPTLFDDRRLIGIDKMLCVTGNPVLDELACHRWQEIMGSQNCYRLWAEATTKVGEEHRTIAHGVPVWPELGPLAQVDYELEEKQATLRVSEGARLTGEDKSEVTPLFRLDDGSAVIESAAVEGVSTQRRSDDVRFIVLDRSRAGVAPLIRSVVAIEESTLEGTFKRLLDEAMAIRQGLDRERVLDDLLRRERGMTSYVGHGVAIAHAYSEQGERPLCVAGHLEPPLVAEGYPDEIRLIFMLISPSGQADLHLAALGRLARVASEAEVVSAILGSESLSQTLSLLRAWERHTEPA